MARAAATAPLRAARPTALEVERREPWPRDIRPGAERVNPFTVRYEGPNMWQVFNHHHYGRPEMAPPMEIV